MSLARWRDALETRQIGVYFAAVALGVAAALVVPGTEGLGPAINPALGFMLFVTFLQAPLGEIGRAFGRMRFMGALLVANFLLAPALVALLTLALPDDPAIRFGVLLVLLAPCIDYVVTFAHLGRADARSLLAATPVLLVAQMLLLPLWLGLMLGGEAAALIRAEPFLHAFLWLIAAPLALAALTQALAARIPAARRLLNVLALAPVPATALVLFVVIAAVLPQLGAAREAALVVAPVYLAYAVLAPLMGWATARAFGLDAPAGRAVAFSAATRNALVVLPFAFAGPEAALVAAVIVTQTLIELAAELVYVRLAPRLGAS